MDLIIGLLSPQQVNRNKYIIPTVLFAHVIYSYRFCGFVVAAGAGAGFGTTVAGAGGTIYQCIVLFPHKFTSYLYCVIFVRDHRANIYFVLLSEFFQRHSKILINQKLSPLKVNSNKYISPTVLFNYVVTLWLLNFIAGNIFGLSLMSSSSLFLRHPISLLAYYDDFSLCYFPIPYALALDLQLVGSHHQHVGFLFIVFFFFGFDWAR